MYPKIESNIPKPSAPPAQSTPLNNSQNSSTSLSSSHSSNPIGFSSLMSQNPINQNNPQSAQASNSAPYPQVPYPVGAPSFPTPSGSQSSAYANQYGSGSGPMNQNQYPSSYSASQGPPQGPPQGQSAYGPMSFDSNQSRFSGAGSFSQAFSGYHSVPPPSQQNPTRPMNPAGAAPFQNQYPAAGNPYGQPPQNNPNVNPYQQTNPYGQPPQNNPNVNPYQQTNPYGQPPQNFGNPYQQGPPQHNNPYGGVPQGGPYGGAQPGYPPQPSVPYQSPYSQQPQPGTSGYNQTPFGGAQNSERIRSIAGRYEISDALAQRLNILQQFELVVLCDDSGSMNAPVQGTQGTRWDELRTIVQIIIEIGTVFDANGVDVHFLNRPAVSNVTDARQVMESFQARPAGYTPLTPALRKIFQTAASKPSSDKRLLVFVATDGAPTDSKGNVDIRSLENLMRNERQAQTTFVTFLACTDDDESVAYLSNWDRSMINVDVVDDYKSERAEIQRIRGPNYPFTFGDYVVKALLGAVDPSMDSLDEGGNNYRPY